MPPDSLISLTARSVLTRSSAPSIAVDVPVSSRTPIRIVGPVGCGTAALVAAPPPHATATIAVAAAIARRLRVPPAVSHIAELPPLTVSGDTPRQQACYGPEPGLSNRATVALTRSCRNA